MNARHTRGGAVMVEVLVAMLIIAFGVLGLVTLHIQTTTLQIEAAQRSQALIWVNDLAQRINLNRTNASAYLGTDIGTTDPGDCEVATTVAGRDVCEWSRLIRGASEMKGSQAVGAMPGARGCVTSTEANLYVLSVAWQGMQPTGAPAEACGKDAYSDEKLRRVVSLTVRIATL